jgi:hypothetical protein
MGTAVEEEITPPLIPKLIPSTLLSLLFNARE